MKEDYYCQLCKTLAKTTGAGVRLYHGKEKLLYYSVYHMDPDPAGPYLQQLLNRPEHSGVITTQLYQFYGFADIEKDYRMVIGPSRLLLEDTVMIEKLLFLLGILDESEKEKYKHLLYCAPALTLERMTWMMTFLLTALTGSPHSPADLQVDVQPIEYENEIKKNYTRVLEQTSDDEEVKKTFRDAYYFEKLVLSHIENGQTDKLRELLSAPPSLHAGQLAHDSLRQAKNTGICLATVAARAAVAGGLDFQIAFRMSDLYIQKIELLNDLLFLDNLFGTMVIDFSEHVASLRYGTQQGGKVFKNCVNYISTNIFKNIRVDEMAEKLGYTRSYLCTQFKKQSGNTLSQYILQEKVMESKRLLQFTDKSLGDIAAHLGFSSQSHFQTVFKKITGETPLTYRGRIH